MKRLFYFLLSLFCFTTACTTPPNQLDGSTWVLQILESGEQSDAIIPGTMLTAEFTANTISGTAGCNWYGGNYQSGKSSLQIDELAKTTIDCHPLISAQEARFAEVLLAADSFLLDNGRLTIISDQARLIFVPPSPNATQPPPSPLATTRWKLVALETPDGPLLPVRGTQITLQFMPDQIQGHGGCNDYAANFHLAAEAYLLLINQISRDIQQCDAAIRLIEDVYFEMLETAVSFTLTQENQTLLIYTEDGTLSFKQTP